MSEAVNLLEIRHEGWSSGLRFEAGRDGVSNKGGSKTSSSPSALRWHNANEAVRSTAETEPEDPIKPLLLAGQCLTLSSLVGRLDLTFYRRSFCIEALCLISTVGPTGLTGQ